MPEKPTKPARRRTSAVKTKTRRTRALQQADIAERAYFIYLDEGSDNELENWLRAERELTAA